MSNSVEAVTPVKQVTAETVIAEENPVDASFMNVTSDKAPLWTIYR